jgi:hypothetical protein
MSLQPLQGRFDFMLKDPLKPVVNDAGRRAQLFEAVLFLLLVIIEAGITFYMIHDHRMPGGHDGFQYFSLQYYFLNHAVVYGEIPQWIPFLTHGTVAAWWYIIQSSILQNVLLLSAGLWKGLNFLPFFYAGIFVDELLLLTGVWLLGRRLFHSPLTVFVVAVSVMGSCIWIIQPWWNFHLYYALPMILYFLHRFLDGGQWRYCLLAGNLLFIQSLGNLPYFLPLISLVIFLYFFFYTAFNYAEVCRQLKNFRFNRSFFLTASVILISFSALYAAMHSGTAQITNYTFRDPDGASPLFIFLTYGGKATWTAWLELVLGVSPGLDYTLYIGIIGLPLIISGLSFNLRKKNLHFLFTVIVLLLFSTGTFVSIFFYYCWPMMKYFRHLMLTATVIKLFLCFLAGFGFEALIDVSSRRRKPMRSRILLAVMSLLMMGGGFVLWHLSGDCDFTTRLLDRMVPERLYRFLTLADEGVVVSLLVRNSIFALIAALLFAMMIVVEKRKWAFGLLISLAFLHTADLYGFKFPEIKLKSAGLNDQAYNAIRFTNLPYSAKRIRTFNRNNPRTELMNALPISYGALYWTVNVMCFMDELGSPFKTDHMLSPLDRYMKAYWGQSICSKAPPLGLHIFSHLEFPKAHPAALKISGVTEDKIQFFTQAKIVPSEKRIASYITAPDYNGDILFLSPLQKSNDGEVNKPGVTAIDLSTNNRLYNAYTVERFDSNNLAVSTSISDNGSAWLMYSDVWHPLWRATVNGKDTPVYKANLAYKAVKLEKGENRVHFYFKSGFMSFLYFLFSLNALFWLGAIIFLAGRIIFAGIIPRHPGPRPGIQI